MPVVYAIITATIAASLADWLFMGVLFHDRYNSYPEVWRQGRGEGGRIALAQAFALLTAGGFVILAHKLGQTDLRGALKLAGMIWLIGPLPLLLGNHLFIKLDPRVTAAHAAGWLAKLLLAGLAVALFLHGRHPLI
jgi:uncharacterized membrane protein